MRNIGILCSFIILVGCNSGNIKPDLPEESSDGQSVTLEEYCFVNECRKNQLVKFRTDTGEVEQMLDLYWPPVQGDTISVLPGEKLFIEAVVFKGKISGFVQVSEVRDPDSTIVFDFTQMDDGASMMLSVKNPFNVTMKYNVNMIDFNGQAHQTSSCPVMPKVGVYEMWPHAIPELLISNFHVLDESQDMACTY